MSALDEMLDQAAELGGAVAEAFEPVRAHRARVDALNGWLETRRRQGERGYGELVRALSEGRAQPDQVPAHLAEAALWSFDSLASRAVVQAAAGARALAEAAARTAGARAFEVLQGQIAVVVDESVELAGRLPATITTEHLMVRSGDVDAARHWMRLRVLVEQWDRLHATAWLLQIKAKLTGDIDESDWAVKDAGPFLKYQNPLKLPKGYGQIAGELKLSRAVAAGAGPGLYGVTLAAGRARAAVSDGRMRSRDPQTMMGGLPQSLPVPQ